MARSILNSKAKQDLNTGLSTSAAAGNRFFRKDGTPNVVRTGGSFWDRLSIYHDLLRMPFGKFMLIVLLVFLAINLLFAFIYFGVGIDKLGGVTTVSRASQFGDAFFFSIQTFTTVGYGRLNPTDMMTNAVAGFQAFVGILSAAVATGLLYGRFTKPQAYLAFSNHALISPYRDGIALMFRLVPYTSHHLTEVEISVRVAMEVEEENGRRVNKFYTLPLELNKINNLFLSWTVVHAIEESSPLYGMSKDDFMQSKLELMVQLRGFDETFANTVFARASYTADEIVFGAKFRLMFSPSADGAEAVVHLDMLHDYDPVDISIPIVTS